MAPRKKTYGTKRATTATGASAIFGQAPPSRSPTPSSRPHSPSPVSSPQMPPSSPVEDLASAIEALALSSSPVSETQPYPSLRALTDAYKSDIGTDMLVKDWADVIEENADVTKIAEASFAEVYRINTDAGSSILKVMRMKLSELPGSMTMETAVDINSLITEFRIMNALTTVPGFVTFKDAHLCTGIIPRCIQKAYAVYNEQLNEDDQESYFPVPPSAEEQEVEAAWYLVIELGDAGDVLDECSISSVHEFWDVFIGVTVALAIAEQTNQFEHRDLHENNICIYDSDQPAWSEEYDPDDPLKFGFSCLQVTVIDYGLSRCRLENGEIAANDLEQDLSLFRSTASGIAGIQYDTYRRMRTHLLDGSRRMQPRDWHTPPSFPTPSTKIPDPPSWNDYIPYTNVLWLKYILAMLQRKIKNDCSSDIVAEIEDETVELKRRFNFRTKVENGAFSTANDVLSWMMGEGWVRGEQIGAEEASLLSLGQGGQHQESEEGTSEA